MDKVYAYLSLGSALFGSEWLRAIVKAIMNREIDFSLTEEQREQVLANLNEKLEWQNQDGPSA